MKNSEFTAALLSSSAAAHRLRERKEELLGAFVRAARAELEAARSVDLAGLVDNLPELLDTLADALEQGKSVANLERCARFGLKHGQARAQQQAYALNDVLIEYRLLSQAIFTTLRQMDRLDLQTEGIIQDAIHRAIANSATEFNRLRPAADQTHEQEREQARQELQTSRLELRNSRQELHDFFMQAPVALCILSGPEHIYTLANPLFLQTAGRNPIGKKVREAFTEEEAGNFFKILDGVYQTGVPHIGRELSFPRQHESGEVTQLYLDIGYHPFRGGDGRIKGILALVQDVTAQVKARKAAEQATEQLRLVADSVPIHLLHLDHEERFLFVNKAAAEMWRLPIEQFIGKTIRDVVGEEAHRDLHPYTRQVLEGQVVSYESTFLAPDGTRRTFLNVYIPHRASDGMIQGFLVAGTDITDRKRTEEVLQASVRGLQEERELRERFVSTLSHDLRTPLTAAKMSSQLLFRSTDDPPRLQKLASRIADNIDRADQMIRDLLDMTRINAGERLSLEKDRCDLNEIAKQTLEELSTIHGDRFVLKARAPIAGFWNCGGIRRILENLCGNGVKYGAPHRPITVSLELEGARVKLQVHNEGAPIPAEELPSLFEPFRRSAAARTGGQRGWGLGLTLVKGFAEAHGGTVSVSSTPQQGTLFTVMLPLDARKPPPLGKPP